MIFSHVTLFYILAAIVSFNKKLNVDTFWHPHMCNGIMKFTTVINCEAIAYIPYLEKCQGTGF
jgi:hypothetical protein